MIGYMMSLITLGSAIRVSLGSGQRAWVGLPAMAVSYTHLDVYKRQVIAKFNMADGVERGLWLEESLQFASMLEEDGQLDALVLTGGSSLLNGMYFFRGDVPMEEFIATQSKVVGLGLRVLGSRIFPELPFEEAFFLPFARQFREALSMPLVLLGGINRRDTIENALDEGFEICLLYTSRCV